MLSSVIRRATIPAIVLVVVAAVFSMRPLAQAPATQKPSSGAQATPNPDLGFVDTPMLPNLPWHVHDPARPHPPVVTPAAAPGGAPSDAIVLFDGSELSKWMQRGSKDEILAPKWPVRDGYFEVGPKTGNLYTRDSFGSVQLHIEWASPTPPTGNSQGRGNSGVLFMGLYEIQVLDTYNNPTYADGQAAAIYGQWPPLANVARKTGEWNVYDIVFEAPAFENGKLTKPAYQTVFWNGVMVHNRKEVMGPMIYRDVASYKTPHAAELPLMLQDHNNPVRYRNVWIRRLAGYDRPESR
jgi:hypothetical protein